MSEHGAATKSGALSGMGFGALLKGTSAVSNTSTTTDPYSVSQVPTDLATAAPIRIQIQTH